MRGYLRTFALFLVFTLILVAVGQVIGFFVGANPTVMFFALLVPALLINFIMYFYSAKIVLWTYRAKIVTPAEAPRLHRIIDQVCLKANMPKPQVALVPSGTPNAFATGRNPKHAVVAATTGIMELLDDAELEGVMAHEMSHVRNRDVLIMTIAAVMASIISYAAYALLFTRNRDVNPLLAIAVYIFAPIAAMLVQLAISRSREFAADSSGAHVLGNPRPLANALLKLERGVQVRPMERGNPATSSLFIVNPFRGGGMVNLFRTHPPTHERVARLEKMNF